jgi:hypothetical protein
MNKQVDLLRERKKYYVKLYGRLVVRGKYCTISQNKTLRILSRVAQYESTLRVRIALK